MLSSVVPDKMLVKSKGDQPLISLPHIIGYVLRDLEPLFRNRFIAESPAKLQNIYSYYAAFYGRNPFPYKKCNAPWVSTVVEADGTVRPCFFHAPLGNIHEAPLDEILNSPDALSFRRNLNTNSNGICNKCVCYLHLPAGRNLNTN